MKELINKLKELFKEEKEHSNNYEFKINKVVKKIGKDEYI